MITRGWIAPDGTEHQISAGDSFFKGFVQCLEIIEEKNPIEYINMRNHLGDILFKPKELVEYAVKHLGFIMIGESNLKIVTCTEDNYQSEVLNPYKEADWTIHVYMR